MLDFVVVADVSPRNPAPEPQSESAANLRQIPSPSPRPSLSGRGRTIRRSRAENVRKEVQGRDALGFTLLEIMIAMALFSLILAAIYSSWTSILRSTRVGLNEAARVQRERMAMRTVVDALLSVQMFAASPLYYSFVADTKGDFAYLSFAAHLPESFPDAGLYNGLSQRRVTFAVEPGTNSSAQLVMYQTPILVDNSASQQGLPIVLARDVTTFGVEFWDLRKNDWVSDWIATNQLPKMVRVTLSTGNANARIQPSDIVTRVVSIPAMVVPADSQFAPPVPGVPGVPPPGTYPPGTYPPGTVPPGVAYSGGPGMGYSGAGPGQPSLYLPGRPPNQ